jgi:hypothetical protein
MQDIFSPSLASCPAASALEYAWLTGAEAWDRGGGKFVVRAWRCYQHAERVRMPYKSTCVSPQPDGLQDTEIGVEQVQLVRWLLLTSKFPVTALKKNARSST